MVFLGFLEELVVCLSLGFHIRAMEAITSIILLVEKLFNIH